MPKEELQDCLLIAKEAALKTGEFLRDYSSHIIKEEGKDVKISADFEAHERIKAFINGSSEWPLLSEEAEVELPERGFVWVVDPLDGSLNFQRKLPFSAISIALVKDREPIIGVVYDFIRDELFVGAKGLGAWLNDSPMQVSGIAHQDKAVLMTGFPSHGDFSDDSLAKYVRYIQNFKKVRLLGSAALSLAYVAAGRGDVYFEKNINLWDTAAGIALVSSAGGYTNTEFLERANSVRVFGSNKRLRSLSSEMEK